MPDTCLACPGPTARDEWASPHDLAPLLCLEHLTAALSAPARVVVDYRGRCWGERMTCPRPAVTRTPHGGWCQVHRPGMPAIGIARPTRASHVPEPAMAAAVVAASTIGTYVREYGHAYGPVLEES